MLDNLAVRQASRAEQYHDNGDGTTGQLSRGVTDCVADDTHPLTLANIASMKIAVLLLWL